MVGDLSVGNGAASNFQATSATVYTAAITPAADGTVTIGVAGAVATDAAGNDNTAAAQFSITNDGTAPRIASIVRQTPPAGTTNADSVIWRLAFDAPMQAITADMFSVNGTTGALSVTNNSNMQTDVTLSGGNMSNLNASVTLLANTTGLTHVDSVDDSENAALKLDGVRSLTTATIGGATYLFAASITDSGISDYAVDGTTGELTNVDKVDDSENAALLLDGALAVTTAMIGGATYLFAAGYTDSGISVFAVDGTTGELTNVDNVADSENAALKLRGMSFVTTAEIGGTTYLFAAGAGDEGVSVFSVDGSTGELTNVDNVADSENAALELWGVRSLTTATIGGATYLFAAGYTDDGVSVFSVNGATGELTNVDNVADSENAALELDGAWSLTTATIGDTTYLFTASTHDDGVSVFSVNGVTGELTNVDNVDDSENAALELDGAQSVTTAVIEGTTYLFVGGATDDGVSVFSVNGATGELTNVDNVDDSENAALQLNGAGSVTTVTIGGKTYLFTAGSYDEGVSVFSLGGYALDLAGNGLANATPIGTNDSSFNVENIQPTLTVTGPTGPVSGAFTATFTFDEAVTDFTIGDISVGNGAASNLQATSATIYTATITPATDGSVTVDVAGSVATDEAGNDNTAATQFSIANDETAPTLAITGPAGPVSGAFTATFTFDEDVTDFTIGDISVGNGAASNFQATSATIYTATITPAADGAVTLDVAGSVATDAAGNDNTAATQFSITNDETAPTLAITGPTGPVSGAFTATFTFDEDVTDFTIGDISVGNGAASNFQATSATIYTATITPATDGSVTLDVAGAVASDTASNNNTAATQFSVANDETAPTLAITGPAGPVSGTFTATFTFDEDVSDFVVGDITVGNGAASAFDDSAAPIYTATITPAADGSVTLDVAGSVATDAAGNDNTAATQFSITNDETAPTLAITGPAGPVSGTFTATFTFDEDVTGFVVGDITVGNGAASAFDDAAAPIYTATITPAADGAVTLDVAGSVATDDAGNDNTAATQFSVTNDETAPTLLAFALPNAGGAASLSSPAATAQTDADTLVFRAVFSESVSNVTADDFVVTGTTATVTSVTPLLPTDQGPTPELSGLASATDVAVYELTVSGGDLADLNGVVGLNVAAGQNIADIAGNAFAGAEPATDETYNVINDADAPTVASITRDTPSTELTNADSLTWVVRFSENVTDIDTGDFVVSGTTGTVTSVSPQAVNLPPSVTGNGYSAPMVVSSSAFTVTASGGDLASYNGVVTLSFAQGQDITDDAGNALTNTTPSGANENSYTLDNTAPTVTLTTTTTATAPVSGPFTLTATFSEDVTGFDVGDLSVGNGTASNFAVTSATVYTATITPGAGSSTTVDVASAAATDAAGNDNIAATQFSIAHDADRTLTVSLPGVGSGTVTSAPVGIDCGTDCSQDYTLGTSVTLTAAADTGSSFAGWTAGPCIGTATATCGVTMSADTSVSARFTLDTPPAGRIVAATLPGARSGYVGGPVISAFLSVVSRTSSPAQSCQVTAPAGAPVTLGYNQLDTNGDPVGPDSPLFDIEPGGALNFVIGMIPTTQTGPDGYSFLPVITCQNASLDPIVGVNDVLLTIGAAPAPDILSIAATPSGDGVIRIAAPGGLQFMAASAVNIGAGDGSAGRDEVTLTTTVDTGAAVLPLTLEICQINVASICITPRGLASPPP